MKYELHGMKKTPEYSVWKQMKYRCTSKSKDCIRYNARGIAVCEEWQKSFLAFYNHIGPRPDPEYQIDRINNDGNYEPGNVRWATRSQQARNRRNRKSKYDQYAGYMYFLSVCGLSLRAIARIFGTGHSVIRRHMAPDAVENLRLQ